MVYLTGITKRPQAYNTVQFGPTSDDHFVANSDLSYGVHGPEMLLIQYR